MLTIQVEIPASALVNASTLAAFKTAFAHDIALSLAASFNVSVESIEPYIVVQGIGAAGSGRRLLQNYSPVSVLILGNVSSVISNGSLADSSMIALQVAQTLSATITAGNFVASSSGATVPALPVSIAQVNPSSIQSSSSAPSASSASSSSTGSLSEHIPVDGSSDSKSLGIGLGVGLGLGLPIILAVLITIALYYNGMACFKPNTAGVGARPSFDAVSPKPAMPKTVANLHTDDGEEIHMDEQEQVQEPNIHV